MVLALPTARQRRKKGAEGKDPKTLGKIGSRQRKHADENEIPSASHSKTGFCICVRSCEIVRKNHELRADLFDAIEGAQASAIGDVHDARVKLYLLVSNLEWTWGLSEIP